MDFGEEEREEQEGRKLEEEDQEGSTTGGLFEWARGGAGARYESEREWEEEGWEE